MQALLTDQARLVMLIVLCGLLWALESIIPLYRFHYHRMRHAMPNVALTLILVITNLSLSFSSAYLADFSVRNDIGLFPLLDSIFLGSNHLWCAGVRPLRLLRTRSVA